MYVKQQTIKWISDYINALKSFNQFVITNEGEKKNWHFFTGIYWLMTMYRILIEWKGDWRKYWKKKCEFRGKNQGLNAMKLLSGVMLSLKPQMW